MDAVRRSVEPVALQQGAALLAAGAQQLDPAQTTLAELGAAGAALLWPLASAQELAELVSAWRPALAAAGWRLDLAARATLHAAWAYQQLEDQLAALATFLRP